MAKVVVPRVLPMFVHDVVTSSAARRLDHLDLFADNARRIFSSRFEAPDVVELFQCLFKLTRRDGSAPTTSDTELQAVRIRALRVLTVLFADGELYITHTFKALRTLANSIGAERAAKRAEVEAEYDRATSVLPPEAIDPPASSPSAGAATPLDNNANSSTTSPTAHRITCPLPDDPTSTQDHSCCLDDCIADLVCRGTIISLFTKWDMALIDVGCFVARPQTLHVYIPYRMASPARVFRDFAICTQRPKLTKPWGSSSFVHVKTNIPAQSDIMYRFLVEGYNYGVNAAVFSDVVGCTNRRWKEIGNMTQYGWPEGWDAAMTNDYAPGCAISQYYSSDRFLTLRLQAKSMFSVGFSVSAWMVFHGYGAGFEVAASFYHQDDDL